jgi:uncharacterized protein with PIN domain
MLGRLCRWLRVLGVDAEFVEAAPGKAQQQHKQQQQQQQQCHQDLQKGQQQQQQAHVAQSALVELIHKAALQEVGTRRT